MSWQAIEQPAATTKPKSVPVSASLKPRQGMTLLHVTIAADLVLQQLGWAPDERLTLLVGTDRHKSRVVIKPHPTGRLLKQLPKGTFFQAALWPGDDLAAWEAVQSAVGYEVHAGSHELEVTLPWDFTTLAPKQEQVAA